MTSAIIVAAGRSERMGSGTDKAFLSLGSKPVVVWALLAFEGCTAIDRIVLVVRKDQMVAAKTVVQMFGLAKVTEIVAGGPKRQESVRRGLEAVDPDTRIVSLLSLSLRQSMPQKNTAQGSPLRVSSILSSMWSAARWSVILSTAPSCGRCKRRRLLN
jgi:hypothetical protein